MRSALARSTSTRPHTHSLAHSRAHTSSLRSSPPPPSDLPLEIISRRRGRRRRQHRLAASHRNRHQATTGPRTERFVLTKTERFVHRHLRPPWPPPPRLPPRSHDACTTEREDERGEGPEGTRPPPHTLTLLRSPPSIRARCGGWPSASPIGAQGFEARAARSPEGSGSGSGSGQGEAEAQAQAQGELRS